MKTRMKPKRKEVLARLGTARLAVPERWAAIEGQLDANRYHSVARDAAGTAIDFRPVRRTVPRLVAALNVVLALAIVVLAVSVLRDRTPLPTSGTNASVPVATSTGAAADPSGDTDLPQYPVSSRWATMQFRDNSLEGCRSASIDRIERFDPDTGDWTPAAPGYAYRYETLAGSVHRYPYLFAMVDLEAYPLEPGLYRATMTVLSDDSPSSECRAEFEIVESGPYPEFMMNLVADTRAEPGEWVYQPAGLAWGMDPAAVRAALGLTEEDFLRSGDEYTRKSPVRVWFPDAYVSETYVFTDDRLDAVRYEVVPVESDRLLEICGQLGALRADVLSDDWMTDTELAYLGCLLPGGSNASGGSENTDLSMIGGSGRVSVTLSSGSSTTEPIQNTRVMVSPLAEIDGIPQYPADAESILLRIEIPDPNAGYYDIRIEKYERYDPGTGTWQRVLENHGTAEIKKAPFPGLDFLPLVLSIGDPEFGGPPGAGRYRAVGVIHAVYPNDVVENDLTMEFDLVDAG